MREIRVAGELERKKKFEEERRKKRSWREREREKEREGMEYFNERGERSVIKKKISFELQYTSKDRCVL